MSSKGKLWELDQDGFLINDAEFAKINPAYLEVIEAVKLAYLKHLSPVIHSLYLTGSIPRGTAKIGQSDLDAFAVLNKDMTLSEDYLSKERSNLLSRFPVVTDIQMEIWLWNDIFDIPKELVTEHQAILRLNSTCLFGHDLSHEILPIKPDIALANTEVIQIRNDVNRALFEIRQDDSNLNIQYWCKRIAKNLIRAAFYLVMPDIGAFTRDLDLCSELFLQHYPNMREIKTCLGYVEQPTGEASVLTEFLEVGFGGQLLQEVERWLNSHNPTRALHLKRS